MAELEERLWGRGQDSEEAIAKRLQRATEELEAATEFDIQLVNDSIEDTLQNLDKILFHFRE